ncbi:lanthionine synthetase C family protein [Toxoplasma gondii TgCatPRC2]|uniref:Lanthionine synthetase C family protein n=4 Tax=Toxoplasma gondii TaxID=5811 RepID=A0A151HHG0_TOXGO|nr:lanthionine synthetase C family protein [Toxoplasma gondii ME49]EPT31253.1 lanthionine synthetase C family protein [Toxoplasma gondii ME49]KYF43707.1 lanthionine synthetase C family protein [Toxoplasma gondii ARI]KYK68802.1 lanthionine synthetase C family protein [Toxoplasma gondii TgCatPRC2]PIM00104.1 lanthionine synthetase C family protein [Toxoplasma gondii COUG]|eukprot:XP_018637902.1 lanthionine synthetase C family protein [Toxoplasma gondii ME49]
MPRSRTLQSRAFLNVAAEAPASAGPMHLIPGTSSLRQDCVAALEDRLQETARCVRSAGTVNPKKGSTVYVGSPGIAYAFLKLATIQTGDQKQASLDTAQKLLSPDVVEAGVEQARRHRSLGPSLLCGPAGLFVVQALLGWQQGLPFASQSAVFQGAVQSYKQYFDYAVHELDSDEWLYGRAGYLYGCLFLNFLAPGSVSEAKIKQLSMKMLESGEAYGRRTGASPLLYSWHDREYLGAAHGVMGIVYMLMLVEPIRNDPNAMRLVKGTLEWLLTLETKHHNWPAVRGETDDYLCHFCHGATGAVFAFGLGSIVFNNREFQKAALRAATCVWKYGLLKKGPGICHGISGSGYALLMAYKLTRDPIWLDRAADFALKMFDEKLQADSRVPDNPFSLFEGLSGAICFLVDLLKNPLKAAFPLFELGF